MKFKEVTALTAKHPGIRLLLHELALWRDLLRWIRKILAVPEDSQPILAKSGRLSLPIAMTCVSVVEIFVVELLLTGLTRWVVLFVSVYSLLLLWAFVGRGFVYPHFLTKNEIVFRHFGKEICRVPLSFVSSACQYRSYYSKARDITSGVLILGGSNGTNVRLMLTHPTAALPDQWPWQAKKSSKITEIQFYCDRPKELLNYLSLLSSPDISSSSSSSTKTVDTEKDISQSM